MNVFSLQTFTPTRRRSSPATHAPRRRQAGRGVAATLGACAFAVATALISSAYARPAAGQEPDVSEYQLKAAFLYNFAKFVEWPEAAFADASATFRLCVVGGEPFAGAQRTLAGKTVKGRSVEVRRVASAADARECHMLFVGAHGGEKGSPTPTLTGVGRHTLTVGETSGFTDQGGVINLVRVDNKIRFEIDRAGGERSGFRFSSQLLKLAILVGGRP